MGGGRRFRPGAQEKTRQSLRLEKGPLLLRRKQKRLRFLSVAQLESAVVQLPTLQLLSQMKNTELVEEREFHAKGRNGQKKTRLSSHWRPRWIETKLDDRSRSFNVLTEAARWPRPARRRVNIKPLIHPTAKRLNTFVRPWTSKGSQRGGFGQENSAGVHGMARS
ncbi:hypothetical protein GWK47_014299 [Chionoecetes opilio]|uniref:Uncharacterized protein n=1 Tax=Chionoecetes opilio TaxID=41210 RepID=A0A8J4XTJ6_CHIOP|nr:hypothetical protein GWK47_014299 [Chionoecetes opilio]